MSSELSILSFICAFLIAVFIPVRRIRMNVPNLSLVSWLVGCNIVDAINTLVWADDDDPKVPVWCDIGTKLVLAASVAIPGACVCISRQLELAASSRAILVNARIRRNSMLFDILLCYILPLIYLPLHFVGQGHRFDLVKGLGCSASIHPSSPALIAIWFPSLILCSINFVYCVLAMRHSSRLGVALFYTHILSRSPMSPSHFFRRITMSFVMTSTVAITTIFSIFSVPTIVPWTSWSVVHAHIHSIHIVRVPDDIAAIRLVWWRIPIISIVYIILSFSLGEETRDSAKWVRELFTKGWRKPSPNSSSWVILPRHKARHPSEASSSETSQSVELKSGWDDMLDATPPKRKVPKTKLQPRPFSPASSQSSCPRPSTTTSAQDEAFMTSTISYLGSPTAQILGLTSPLTSPPPTYASPGKDPRRNTPQLEPIVLPLVLPSRTLLDAPHMRQSIPDDVESTISAYSTWDELWPKPPSLVSTIALPSRHRSPSPSLSPSRTRPVSPIAKPGLGAHDPFGGYPMHPPLTPPHMQGRPFHGPGISEVPEIPALPTLEAKKSVLAASKLHHVNNRLKGSWSREKGHGHSPSDVIYMTMVKETV